MGETKLQLGDWSIDLSPFGDMHFMYHKHDRYDPHLVVYSRLQGPARSPLLENPSWACSRCHDEPPEGLVGA